MSRPWELASTFGRPSVLASCLRKKQERNSCASESERSVYFSSYYSMYFLLRVLTRYPRPFEGALVPQEKGAGTQNPGTWHPKLPPRSGSAALGVECSSNRVRAPLFPDWNRTISFVLGLGTLLPRWPSPSQGEGPQAGRLFFQPYSVPWRWCQAAPG